MEQQQALNAYALKPIPKVTNALSVRLGETATTAWLHIAVARLEEGLQNKPS
jgi:hypothetical protein